MERVDFIRRFSDSYFRLLTSSNENIRDSAHIEIAFLSLKPSYDSYKNLGFIDNAKEELHGIVATKVMREMVNLSKSIHSLK